MPRLGPEALEEGRVGGVLGFEDLHRDVAGQHLVARAPQLAHPAGGDPIEQQVPVGERHLGSKRDAHPRIAASMTCLAIGAATVPPVPCGSVFSTTTATATWGSAAGAKLMNHVYGAGPLCCAVPVLPATPMPGICAAVPVPFCTTVCIIEVSCDAMPSLTARPSCCGCACDSTDESGARSCATR